MRDRQTQSPALAPVETGTVEMRPVVTRETEVITEYLPGRAPAVVSSTEASTPGLPAQDPINTLIDAQPFEPSAAKPQTQIIRSLPQQIVAPRPLTELPRFNRDCNEVPTSKASLIVFRNNCLN